MSYSNLLERIANLEKIIDNNLSQKRIPPLVKDTLEKIQSKDYGSWISPLLKEKGKICIFKKCPKGTKGKNTFMHGLLEIPKGQLCYFEECPIHTTPVGYKTKHGKSACSFKTCPPGSQDLNAF